MFSRSCLRMHHHTIVQGIERIKPINTITKWIVTQKPLQSSRQFTNDLAWHRYKLQIRRTQVTDQVADEKPHTLLIDGSVGAPAMPESTFPKKSAKLWSLKKRSLF